MPFEQFYYKDSVISMHECLCKALSQDCPHGEVAFSNSEIKKKQWAIKFVKLHNSCLKCVNDTLWFHLPIVDYYIMQFDIFFC